LTALIALPLVGSALTLATGRGRDNLARQVALGISLVTFVLSLVMWAQFDASSAAYQFEERHSWLPDFGVSYHVGVDGISLFLIVLTTFLTPISLLCAWESIEERVREFCFFMLALEAAMIGVFVSLDLFLFYVFWDAMLIPMYFLIGIWGYDRRIYAAIKFILYTMAGSVLMLIAILWIAYYHQSVTGVPSFDLVDLYALDIPRALQTWLFLAFAVAFAIKVPLFPFHTWLPDAHVQAPTAGSVILAGVLLKMGTYGLLRFAFPLFPEATMVFLPWLATLSVIGIVYGALVAMVQPDMKKLVAYSSVSHLGFVMLGIWGVSVISVQGALMVMISHGISTGALFLLIGMIYERRHTRLIEDYGGIARVVPLFSLILTVVALSSIGLPGLNGFVGEFLVLLGSFRAYPWATGIATTGVIFAAAYLLWALQRMIFNRLDNPENERLTDLNRRELAVLIPLIIGIVWLGLFPGPVLRRMEPATQRFVEGTQSQGGSARLGATVHPLQGSR